MIAENDKSAPRRVALLLFGLLNTFDQVYGPEAASPSLRDALIEADFMFDVFFDTSPVEFCKVPGTYSLDDTVLKGRKLIDRVIATRDGGRHYLIIEEEEASIRTRIETAFPNIDCCIHFDPPDSTTWSGEGHLERMIRTFLRRKKRLTQAAIAYSQYNNFAYDALIVARPDSVIRVRGRGQNGLIQLAHQLADDVSKASDTETVGVDILGYDQEKSDPGIALFKNDIFIASPLITLISMSLIDVLDSNGRYSKSYQRPAYRCKNCRTMFNEVADECRACGCLHKISSVRNWPEYKLAEHIAHSGLRYRALGIGGDVLRSY